jgi:hypothetical protein
MSINLTGASTERGRAGQYLESIWLTKVTQSLDEVPSHRPWVARRGCISVALHQRACACRAEMVDWRMLP